MTGIISFLGADHKCGTGMISQCVAERIAASMPELKILLIHTNGRSGNDYSPTASESMDDIRPYMADRLIDSHEIIERSRWKDNIHIISGSMEFGSASIYDPGKTSFMLQKLREDSDLIICDSGAEIEHGLAIGSLISSDMICLVLTQSESAIRNYEWQNTLLNKLKLEPKLILINKFDKGSPYSRRYISERLMVDSEKIMTVKMSEYGSRAEYDERSLVNYPGTGFRKDIDSLAKTILEYTGLKKTSRR